MRKTCRGSGSTRLAGVLAVGLGGLVVALGATSAVAQPSAAFTIRSSLDGRDETTMTTKTGYLVTTWLSPGKHEFTVRARGLGANRQTTATRTVVARVLPRPAAPAQLTGTWQRHLPTAVPPDSNVLYRSVTAEPGTYRFAVAPRFIRMSGPAPRRHIKIDYVAGPATITIRGPVWTGDPKEGAICDPWGPETTYSWSVSDDTLTLAPASSADACKQRGAIVTGEWTRVR